MEQQSEFLATQISKAENDYDQLCQMQQDLIQQCRCISQDLEVVEKAMSHFGSEIISATKMSHVGAPQAISAMQHAISRLNKTYKLLKSDRSCKKITSSTASSTARMIHFSPDMAAQQKKLAELSGQITAKNLQMSQHILSLQKEQSLDMEIYRERAEQVQTNITWLGKMVAGYAECLAEAQKLYSEAQKAAIARANQIPY